MLTIDDFKNVRRQNLRVAALEERIERLRSRAEYNQRQLGECGRSDPTRDRLAEYAAEIDELEREFTGEMIALEKQLAFVDAEMPQEWECVTDSNLLISRINQKQRKMHFCMLRRMGIAGDSRNSLFWLQVGIRIISTISYSAAFCTLKTNECMRKLYLSHQ